MVKTRFSCNPASKFPLIGIHVKKRCHVIADHYFILTDMDILHLVGKFFRILYQNIEQYAYPARMKKTLEINRIKAILKCNGYPGSFIQKQLMKSRNQAASCEQQMPILKIRFYSRYYATSQTSVQISEYTNNYSVITMSSNRSPYTIS